MNTFIKSSFAILFLIVSGSAFADKVTITTSPVVVEQRDGVWVSKEDAVVTTSSNGYYYFDTGSQKEVCYQSEQPSLASVMIGPAKFRIGGSDVELHCYKPSNDYFIVP